jgi:hypothetical protein
VLLVGAGAAAEDVGEAWITVVGMFPGLVRRLGLCAAGELAGELAGAAWLLRKRTKRRKVFESTLAMLKSCDTAPFSLWMEMALVLLAGVVGALLLVA